MDGPGTTRLERRLDAPPDAVYRALTDATSIAKWRVPDDMGCEVLEWRAEVGGRIRIALTYHAPDRAGKTVAATDVYHGRFIALEPGKRVVETMEFETEEPAMRGTMTLESTLTAVEGGTLLRIEHRGVPAGVSPADNEAGWRMALDRLARLIADA
jgi:uncharacterized protein YndB with AHSA1/START domain